ncbi:MAG: cell division protein SepF [Firmicutes bacterium]|nr:cell division protein SepF [Bacillota bacterium]
MAGKMWDKLLSIIGFEDEVAAVEDEVSTGGDSLSYEGTGQEGPASGQEAKVLILAPQGYSDVEELANHLKNDKAVIVTLEALERDLAKRIVDFMSGVAYALDGDVQRVAEGIFVFAPKSVVVDADSYAAAIRESAIMQDSGLSEE